MGIESTIVTLQSHACTPVKSALPPIFFLHNYKLTNYGKSIQILNDQISVLPSNASRFTKEIDILIL